MGRTTATAAFQAVLGVFLAAPLGFAIADAFAPPDVYTQLLYGLPLVVVCGALGGYGAVRYGVPPLRLGWAIVTLYVVAFVALVALQSVAYATVGLLGGPLPEIVSLAVGALCAYVVATRRA